MAGAGAGAGADHELQHLPRNRLALAITVAVHLLAVLIWAQRPHLRIPAQPEMVWMMLRPTAPIARRDVRPPVPPAPPRQRQAAKEGGHVLPATPRHAASPPAESAAPSDAQPATNAEATPQTVPQAEQSGAGTQAGPRFDLDLARREARRSANDGPRESRLLAEPDTRWARLARGLDAAHVAPATGVQQDSYTAPDGTIVYRKRVGNRFYCRRSGDVTGSDIPGAGGGGNAGSIACPSQAEWKPLP